MPLSLNDAEYAAVQAAAAPIHPLQRGVFLKAVAEELERHPVIGPGLVHRCAAALQKDFGVTAHSETSHTAEPHTLGRARRADELGFNYRLVEGASAARAPRKASSQAWYYQRFWSAARGQNLSLYITFPVSALF
jgi:hypothetical protein